MASAKYSRTKGHNAEREYAQKFRELGYEHCRTSREASRLLDNSKIDLAFLPFNVQIKAGFIKQRPNVEAVFKEMKQLLKENFPPDEKVHGLPKLCIHRAHARTDEGELVTMTWDDFVTFFLKPLKQPQDECRKTQDNTGV